MTGCGVTLLLGLALGLTSWWHARVGGWWPPAVLAAVALVALVGAAVAQAGKR